MAVDRLTKKWIWNAGDEYAASEGCRFDEKRGQHIAEVCETYFRLWEGDYAGQPMRLTNWQWDCLARVFGWVRWSEKWQRWVRRFRIASIWVPKKNKKSPTGAAVGLYLLRWDGEPGAKVWSAAHDGKQAGIVHGHAINMVKASGLEAEFKINMADRRIIHEPSLSVYGVLAGDNIPGQEGLNGSVIIDEAHVVDDRLARVLADMGASRSEPLRFEISTAGNDLGYGRKQYEYGREVEAGRVHDSAFFFRAYEAPQTTKDEDIYREDVKGRLTKATIKLWTEANPALGETVDIDEMKSSCKRAMRSEADWAGWKQRRLNLWQFAASVWINQGQWAKCAANFDLPDAREAEFVGIGLDLARVSDTSSAVYAWSLDDGRIRMFPRIWLPEGRLRQIAVKVAEFEDWAKDGHVELTPGDVTDFAAIEDQICQDVGIAAAEWLAYDPYLATEITGRIADRVGVGLIAFKQDFATYTAPTKDFKRLVLDGKIQHPSNPCWKWQMGHAITKEVGEKEKPVKDAFAKHKRIDTVQAAIMALHALQYASGTRSFYEDHELELI